MDGLSGSMSDGDFISADGPANAAFQQFRVHGVLPGGVVVAKHEVKDAGLAELGGPGDVVVAEGVVDGQQDMDFGGGPEAVVGLVFDGEIGQAVGDGVVLVGDL